MQQYLHAVASDSASQAKLISMGLAETDAWAKAEASPAPAASATSYDHQKHEPYVGKGPESGTNQKLDAEGHVQHAKPQCSGGSSSGSEQSRAERHSESSQHESNRSNSPAPCIWRVSRLNLLRHMARLQTHLDVNEG